MTDPNDFNTLEQQLAALRPFTPSVALQTRIAAELRGSVANHFPANDQRSLSFQRWRRWSSALCGAACAASLILIVLWQPEQQSPLPRVPPVVIQYLAPVSPAPTLWNYRNAFDESSQQFGELLDRHAARLLPPTPDFAFSP